MVLKADNLFRGRQETIRTFNFRDVLTGAAYVKYYLGEMVSEDTIYESYTTGDDANNVPTTTTWFAQTFTIGNTGTNEDFFVRSISLKADVGDIWTISIQAVDGSNHPDGTDLIAMDFIDNAQPDPDIWIDIPIQDAKKSHGLKLSASTTYAIVMKRKSGSANSQIRSDNSSPTYGGGNFLTTTDSGGTWTADTNKDFLFEIHGQLENPKILFPQTFISELQTTTFTIVENDYVLTTQPGSIDFEITINKSGIIDGKALVNLVSTLDSALVYLTCTLSRERGGSSTAIGTCSNKVNAAPGTTPTNIGMSITCARTKLNVSDVLKFSIVVAGKDTTGTDDTYTLTHTGSGANIFVPFKLDI
jgi:hypothetical protein